MEGWGGDGLGVATGDFPQVRHDDHAREDDEALSAFVQESNRIEGINRTTSAHLSAHRKFLMGALHIPALIELVGVLQPDARFRNDHKIGYSDFPVETRSSVNHEPVLKVMQ